MAGACKKGETWKEVECQRKDCDEGLFVLPIVHVCILIVYVLTKNTCFAEINIHKQTVKPEMVVETNESKMFLVLGGSLAFRSDVEVLDLSKSSTVCTKPADIPEKFTKSAVGAYLDRKVMLCGGWLAGRECVEYKLSTHEWIEVPYSLNIERAEMAGAMLQNGSWLIIGGKGLDHEPLYSTDFLNDGIFEPNLQWPEAISGHCMISLNSSHVFVSGGEGKDGKLLGEIYFLNIDRSFWMSLEVKMRYKRRGHVCGITNNGDQEYIIMAGGQDILKTEMIDTKTLRFRQGPDLPFKMDWAARIQFVSSIAIVGGEHIGYCSTSGMCTSSNSILEIDVQNNTWKVLDQSLKLPRSSHIILRIDDREISNDLCQDVCSTCRGKIKWKC